MPVRLALEGESGDRIAEDLMLLIRGLGIFRSLHQAEIYVYSPKRRAIASSNALVI